MLIGQHFRDGDVGYQVSAGLFRRGVLISGTLTNAKSIRIEPPLVIEYDEIDEILNRLEDTLKAVTGAPASGDVLQFPAVEPVATGGATNGHVNGHANGHATGKVKASKQAAKDATAATA